MIFKKTLKIYTFDLATQPVEIYPKDNTWYLKWKMGCNKNNLFTHQVKFYDRSICIIQSLKGKSISVTIPKKKKNFLIHKEKKKSDFKI